MRQVLALGLHGLREALRDRIYISLPLVSLITLTTLRPEGGSESFHEYALGWIYFSGVLALVLPGAWLLYRERRDGIWEDILARPVYHHEYLAGKLLGLLLVLASVQGISIIIYLLTAYFRGIEIAAMFHQGVLMVFLETSLLAGLLLLFFSILDFIPALLLSLLAFVGGHALAQGGAAHSGDSLAWLGWLVSWLLPKTAFTSARTSLEGMPALLVLRALVYCLGYLSFLLSLSLLLLSRRVRD